MKNLIACIAAVILIIAFCVGINCYRTHKEVLYLNNGIHEDCGGKWKKIGINVGKRRFIYECDKCGEMLGSNFEIED